MNVIIQDLGAKNDKEILKRYGTSKDTVIISEKSPVHTCAGCFGCWVKTPGQCVINDEYQKMGALFGSTDSLLVISRNCYGSYSPFIKAMFDRSISYVNPDFTTYQGEIHHKRRYKNNIQYEVIFYGEISEEEKKTAKELALANVTNFRSELTKVSFVDGKEAILNENSIH